MEEYIFDNVVINLGEISEYAETQEEAMELIEDWLRCLLPMDFTIDFV